MIQVIIFDLGNVLLPFDPMRAAKGLAPYSTLTPEKILQELWDEDTADEFESGRMSVADFYKRAVKKCDLSADYDTFKKAFNDIFVENGHNTSLLNELKKFYKLGLISNTNKIHTEFFMSKYSFFKLFDDLILSHEVGLRKPSPDIYHLALERLKCEPGGAVFIDDNEVNVVAANNVGMHGICFKNHEQLIESMRNLGICRL